MRRIWVIGLGLFSLALVIFAISRVIPYLKAGRPDPMAAQHNQIVRVITNSSVPEYDVAILRQNVDLFSDMVRRKVYQSLLQLPVSERPSTKDAESISHVFANFYALNRSGTREEAISRYAERGIPPPHVLVQDDQVKAENGWKLSTAWAREAEPQIDTLAVHATFVRGNRTRPERGNGAAIEARTLPSGGYLSLDNHRYTAYEVVITSFVPNLDGQETIEVDICVSIINDRVNGGWDIAETTWDQLPDGKRFRLPLP
jgi:hypothetical protein